MMNWKAGGAFPRFYAFSCVQKVTIVLVVAVPRPGLRSCRPGPYISVLKMATWLAGALPRLGSYNCVLKSSAVLVVAVSRPDPYSCVTYEGGSWAGSYAGGGCS
jgi:hypothetical protein